MGAGRGSQGKSGNSGLLRRRRKLRCGAEFLDIGEIAQATRGKLRRYQILFRDKEGHQAGLGVNDALDTTLPRAVKIDPRKVGKYVEAVRVMAETKESGVVGKLLWGNSAQWRSETG